MSTLYDVTQHENGGDPMADGSVVARRVGERIHSIMWRERISQADLATVIGVSQSTLSKKLRGRVPITVTELVAIADALGVEAWELLPRRRAGASGVSRRHAAAG